MDTFMIPKCSLDKTAPPLSLQVLQELERCINQAALELKLSRMQVVN